jgi:hypothetical protein
MVEMHQECLKTLNISDITVKEFRPPRGLQMLIFTACVMTFITFASRNTFQPGSIPYNAIFKHVPNFAAFCYTIQPLLITFMVVVHLGEATYMAMYRLRPHRIPLFSRLWWMWFINDFIEGITTLHRFDAIVQEERLKKQHNKPTPKK